MFNIYYINYAKAFEISMLIDNKMLEMITKTKEGSVELEGKGAVNLEKTKKIPLLNKAIPAIDISGEITGSKSKNVIDTIKVVSTKSTILEPIYKKAKEIKRLSENSIGNLIKIKNVSLIIDNIEDILATKTLLSGLLNSVAIDGFGEMNLTSVLEILFKDSSYILSGKLPQRFGGDEKIMLKIPMSAENEMENQYSISDLEIGKVTVIGIYRGNYKEKEIRDKVDKLRNLENKSNFDDGDDIEDGDLGNIKSEKTDNVHYIDVIAVAEEIFMLWVEIKKRPGFRVLIQSYLP